MTAVVTTLDGIYRDFAERLDGLGTLVCAGGAVRDYLRAKPAKDYDLFLLGRTLDDELAKRIKERLSTLEELKPLEFHKSEPYLVSTVRAARS
jgi:tRNA nucleotidyltransferase/poly(A) polymerase